MAEEEADAKEALAQMDSEMAAAKEQAAQVGLYTLHPLDTYSQ